MAKRPRRQHSPGQPTPKEIKRRRKTSEERRKLLLAAGGVFAVIILILGFGLYRENFAAPRKPVAIVNGRAITTKDYQDRVTYERFDLVTRFGGQIDQDTLVSFLDTQLPSSVLETMIDQVLIEQYADEAGIAVSDAEVQKSIEEQFGFTGAEPTPEAGDGITITESAPSITQEDFNTAYRNFLDALKTQTSLGEAFYRRTIRQELVQNKVKEQLTADVATSGHQVHARHILVETEEEAAAARQRVLAGEDFAAVAEELSTDTVSAADGGDLGWFGLGQMVAEFESVAFSLQPGILSPPTETEFGFHIIEVIERDEDHPLSESQLAQARDERYREWRDDRRAGSDIQRLWTAEAVPPLTFASSSAP